MADNKLDKLCLDDLLKQLGINVSSVRFNSHGILPVFGKDTDAIINAYVVWSNAYREKYGLGRIEDKEYFKTMTENAVKEGALIAGIKQKFPSVGQIYELGFGSGIASMAYSILSGEPIISIDEDSASVERAALLAKSLGISNITFKEDDTNTLSGMANPRDLVYAMRVEEKPREELIKAFKKKNFGYLVIGFLFDNYFENEQIMPLSEEGFSFLRFPLFRKGTRVKYEANRDYIFYLMESKL